MSEWIIPDWPAPASVQAVSTIRTGGVSTGAWQSFNLATHVGDDAQAVAANRAQLRAKLGLPAEPAWLEQVHGATVCSAGGPELCQADASFARVGEVAVVMTADCLPVLFCDTQGQQVAAAHAGWRGLASGVLEATAAKFADPGRVMAWLGPAIGPQAFEVGADVREAFVAHDARATQAFERVDAQHWLCDLYALARQRLESIDIGHVVGGGFCTYSEPERFFSFRRDGQTGRMASLIWIQD